MATPLILPRRKFIYLCEIIVAASASWLKTDERGEGTGARARGCPYFHGRKSFGPTNELVEREVILSGNGRLPARTAAPTGSFIARLSRLLGWLQYGDRCLFSRCVSSRGREQRVASSGFLCVWTRVPRVCPRELPIEFLRQIVNRSFFTRCHVYIRTQSIIIKNVIR